MSDLVNVQPTAISKSSKRRRRRSRNPTADPRALDRAVVDAFTSGRMGLRHTDYRSDIRRIERWLQSWMYVCIDRNAVAVTQQTCRMYTREPSGARATKDLTHRGREYLKSVYGTQLTEDTVEVPEHPFLQLLDRPNPLLDRSGLFWLTVAYIQSLGRCFWHMKYDDDGMPVEIWPLPSQYVTPVFGPNSVIDEYEFRIGRAVQRFDSNEIVHFRRPSPIDTISDFGNLRGILESAETDIRMIEYERAIFDNMAVPDILISAKGDTTTHQIEALQANWEQEFKGHQRRGKAAAVPFPVDVTQLSFKNRDLEFDKGAIRIRDKIAAGFGVPIPILTSTSTTFSNMDIGVQLWMRNGIQPLLYLIGTTINHDIMPRYAPTADDLGDDAPEMTPWFIAWDNPVPEDLTSQNERDVADVAAGLVTINEVRHERSKAPVDWGDEPWITSGFVTPSMALENQRFDQEMARMAFERQGATEAAAAESTTPITFSELTSALDLFASIGDKDGVNLIREQMAEQLDGSLEPVSALAPDLTGAVVEPDEAAEKPTPKEEDNVTAQGEQKQENAAEGGEGGQGSGGGEADSGTDKSGAQERVSGDAREDEGDGAGAGLHEPEGCAGCGNGCHKDGDGGERQADNGDLRKDVPGRERWVASLTEGYVKVNQALMEPERRDKTLEVVLATLFLEFEADVLEHLNVIAEKGTKAKEPFDAKAILKALFTRKHWIDRFKAAAMSTLMFAFRKGAELAVKDLEIAGSIVERMPTDRIEKHVELLAESFASVVVDMTGDQLAEALLPGVRDGENIQQLADRVSKVYGKRKDKDAERIARTEVNTAMNAGASETFSESGIKRQEWLASSGACEYCIALDGKTVDVGEPFAALGSSITGTQGGTYKVKYRPILYPTLHPNCTCTIVPIVE